MQLKHFADMEFYEKPVKLRNQSCVKEKPKTAIVKQELVKDMKPIEISVTDDHSIVDLNNLMPLSSQLLCLPENMVQLTKNIQELEISNNDFSQFSYLLRFLHNLIKLKIWNNTLETLPNAIAELKNLKILILSQNELKDVPDSLCVLNNLEILDLSNNQLKNLPFSYSKLQKLKELNISKNKFKYFPKCIQSGMRTLKVLNISQNPSAKINIPPYSKYLEKFYAQENGQCIKIPDWILSPKFFNLKEVNFNKTQFEIFNLIGKHRHSSIQSFSMACSNLSNSVLDKLVERMVNIKIINVGNDNKCGNMFNCIPIHSLKKPELITEINFRGTSLSSIPAAINKLCNLKVLDLGLNFISWLPEQFCELQKLECLKIDRNGFILFPENIGNLKSLQIIRAEVNACKRLPKSFKNLRNLKFIDMYDNIFEQFPTLLLEMYNIKGLDFEQNFFTTDEIKIGEVSYSTLRENYISEFNTNSEDISAWRNTGVKQEASSKSEKSSPSTVSSSNSAGSEFAVSQCKIEDEEEDENWDSRTDSDDEFDPGIVEEAKFNGNSKCYIPLIPLGFCPADLHSKKVKAEVASMRAYGSLPAFTIEEGQFDDL